MGPRKCGGRCRNSDTRDCPGSFFPKPGGATTSHVTFGASRDRSSSRVRGIVSSTNWKFGASLQSSLMSWRVITFAPPLSPPGRSGVKSTTIVVVCDLGARRMEDRADGLGRLVFHVQEAL